MNYTILTSVQGSGDQKFIPEIPKEKLATLAVAADATSIWEQIEKPMYQTPPLSLGPPSEMSQSTYYPGHGSASFQEDAALVSRVMEELSILPENTRLQRTSPSSDNVHLDIFQASVMERVSICQTEETPIPSGKTIRLVKGDHKDELVRINMCLEKALQWVSNPSQYDMIRKLQESFTTGDLNTYKDSQKIWVKDKAPPVEAVLGFVEPYRDPLGIRSEFEGIVGIPDVEETRKLNELSEKADKFVRKLPWVSEDSGNKGPFEKDVFEAPDFSSVKSMNNPFYLDFSGWLTIPRPRVLFQYNFSRDQPSQCELLTDADIMRKKRLMGNSTTISVKRQATRTLYFPIAW